MNALQELFSEVEEEFDDDLDDWDIPVPEEEENWAETWLDGIDPEDVDGYGSEEDFWEL